MTKYNSHKTAFRQGSDWYMVPKGEFEVPRWRRTKNYTKLPRRYSVWVEYITAEDRDTLLGMVGEAGYIAFVAGCEYTSNLWHLAFKAELEEILRKDKTVFEG